MTMRGNKRATGTTTFQLSRQFREDKFISAARQLNGKLYDYTLVVGAFKNVDTPVQIICNRCCRVFKQNPYNHIAQKAGCVRCNIGAANKIPMNLALLRLSKIYDCNFDFSRIASEYKTAHSNITVVCNICHFEIRKKLAGHLIGKGVCPYCTGPVADLASFLNRAGKVHNGKYRYDKVTDGVWSKRKIEIFCLTCNKYFKQSVNNHLTGHGCKICNSKSSRMEVAWLDMYGILEENRQRKLPHLGKMLVDGYDPKTNTVYEFFGDFWHGNLKKFCAEDVNCITKVTFGELNRQTTAREVEIRKHYNLITTWESDWVEHCRENNQKVR